MKRTKVSRRGSKKLFRKTSGTHVKNLKSEPMRGGYRL